MSGVHSSRRVLDKTRRRALYLATGGVLLALVGAPDNPSALHGTPPPAAALPVALRPSGAPPPPLDIAAVGDSYVQVWADGAKIVDRFLVAGCAAEIHAADNIHLIAGSRTMLRLHHYGEAIQAHEVKAVRGVYEWRGAAQRGDPVTALDRSSIQCP